VVPLSNVPTPTAVGVVHSTLWCAEIQPIRFFYVLFPTLNKAFVGNCNWC